MAKGKYTIQRRFIKALDKRIIDYQEDVPKWVKDLKKERAKNEV